MASEEGDTTFVSALDEKSKAIAKAELGELNDKDRALAVQTLRRWVLDQKDWMPSRTDFEFLLRFLRVRKFSQLEARRTIENYWTCKTKIPSIYRDLDPGDKVIQDVLRAGFTYSHKKLDSEGRRYIFGTPGAIPLEKVKEIGTHAVYRAMVLVYEWMMFDENTQVNGMLFMVDYTDMSWQLYLKYASIDDQSNLFKFLQKSMPIRLKKILLYNEPSFMDVLLNFCKPFLTEKFLERELFMRKCNMTGIYAILIYLQQTMAKLLENKIVPYQTMNFLGDKLTRLYEVADKSVIPDEFLPDDCTGAGPKQKIIEEMIDDMMKPKFRDYIRDMNFLGDKLTRLYEVADKSVIPDEFLPDDCTGAGPKQKIIEEMIEDMMKPKFRDYIRDVSSSKYEVDIDKREHMEKEPANSFRKLNVE